MKRFAHGVFAALAVAIVTAPITQAEILVGVPGPYTGSVAWGGAETERGAEMAVAHLNAAGGVLGQKIRIIKADDYCDGEQAVAAARKLVADGVAFVMGHECSGAAIPASRIYADAGVLMMTNIATNPRLTEQGFKNVFRFSGRDDVQGVIAGTYLAEYWSDKSIAILHDGEAYGEGLAQETKKALNAAGVFETMFEEITPSLVDYHHVVEKIQAAGIDVLYYGGYPAEGGLLIRQLRDSKSDLQLVGGDGMVTEDFGLIAGEAAEASLFTAYPDARNLAAAAEVVAAFRASSFEPRGSTLLSYGAMQAWAQAVEKAGTLELDAVIEALRSGEFDTVVGTVGFDEKGDVTGYEPFAWYVWQDGDYTPVDPVGVTD